MSTSLTTDLPDGSGSYPRSMSRGPVRRMIAWGMRQLARASAVHCLAGCRHERAVLVVVAGPDRCAGASRSYLSSAISLASLALSPGVSNEDGESPRSVTVAQSDSPCPAMGSSRTAGPPSGIVSSNGRSAPRT
jgi:hypothetical protein